MIIRFAARRAFRITPYNWIFAHSFDFAFYLGYTSERQKKQITEEKNGVLIKLFHNLSVYIHYRERFSGLERDLMELCYVFRDCRLQSRAIVHIICTYWPISRKLSYRLVLSMWFLDSSHRELSETLPTIEIRHSRIFLRIFNYSYNLTY